MKILHLSLGLACVSACAETEESIGTLVYEDGPRHSWASPLAQHGRAEALLARDQAGRLALVRLDDGEIVTRFEVGELAGVPDASAFVRDDGSLSHLALLSHDEDEQAGRLRFVPSSSSGFARAVDVAEVQGRTRTLALDGGALLMQEDIGQRWSFAPTGGGFQKTTPCPMPASIIASESRDSHAAVLAFAWSADGEPVLLDAKLTNAAWQCELFALTTADTLSESARVAMVPGIGNVLVDAKKSGLRLGRLGGTEVGPLDSAELGAERIEQVEPWSLSGRRGVVVLTSRPAAVTLLALEPEDGGRLAIVETASVLLPFVTESSLFSRELVVSEDRVFVATASGLVGFELALSPVVGLHQAASLASFADLRGPLVAVPRLPAAYQPTRGDDQSQND